MADREKVIKGLEHCTTSLGCFECPYSEMDQRTIECQLQIDRDALELLKEQQPKSGSWTMNSDFPDRLICSECNGQFDVWHWESKQMHFCPCCGAIMDGKNSRKSGYSAGEKKMIRIEKTEFRGQCNCCFGRDDVKEILFRRENSAGMGNGTVVCLCEKCRKELAEELKRHG